MKLSARLLGFVLCGWMLSTASLYSDDNSPAQSPNNRSAPIIDPARFGEHYRQVVTRPQFQDSDDSSLNSHFEDWLSQWLRRFGTKFGELKYSSHLPAFESLLMTLLVTLSIAGLLYIMVRLTRRRANIEEEPLGSAANQTKLHPPEFYDNEIEEAIRLGDWHAAWLASWRQFLSRLEHRHLVEADRTRTNREYLAQLRTQALPATALALLNGMVDAYDRFIYGRKMIAETDWNLFQRQIGEATLLLHLEDKRASTLTSKGAS